MNRIISYENIIGIVYILIGASMILLNRYWTAYIIELNRYFIFIFTKDVKELKKKYVKVCFSILFYLSGLIITHAGILMILVSR